ncbi:ABC transporter ATP-binding protein [Alphaproteobacteria bacterium]|nr:ABC transporter ATP-binding protein [Alphaproteobacteria bacterium]MDC1121287.1 ABC transporter ATP-binding protein [Alphaproteobacteria bacterium]
MSDHAPNNTAIVTATHVSFRADSQTLLNDISLQIGRGTITMVLGHNGAGKTLLLSALHGLIAPQTGKISGPVRHKQKMVFQKPVLLRRSARDYFNFLCPSLDDATTESWFKKAQLDTRLSTPARQLSGGESQKLALIGALASQPDLLFLDEPTAHLDFESIRFIETQITDAHISGTTIIMTSHNRSQAERLAEQIIFMENGKIMEMADAKTFFSAPKTDAAKIYLNHY